jgi:hypothetical protein
MEFQEWLACDSNKMSETVNKTDYFDLVCLTHMKTVEYKLTNAELAVMVQATMNNELSTGRISQLKQVAAVMTKPAWMVWYNDNKTHRDDPMLEEVTCKQTSMHSQTLSFSKCSI